MSGIFGLVDPEGADERLVRRAVEPLGYRGHPRLVAAGPAILGTLERGEPQGLLETDDAILVGDAHVFAVRSGSGAARSLRGESGVGVLEGCLRSIGVTTLRDIAADLSLARYDKRSGRLLLSRDALGTRPLFWARRGRRFGFASDPAFLDGLGLVSGAIDVPAVRSYLFLGDTVDERTAFDGVSRVPGGTWISFDQRSVTSGEWFRPEEEPELRWSLDEAAHRSRELLIRAVRDRCEGERPVLCLTGGRDSGSVAVALALAGIKVTCLTVTFPTGVAESEARPARELARAFGHDWIEVPVPTTPTPEQLEWAATCGGTPFGVQPITAAFGILEAARELGASVVLNGEGGEPLFAAPPIAVWDLLRSGHPRLAAGAARRFRDDWGVPPSVIAKSLARAAIPRSLLWRRELLRSRPPWLMAPAAPDLGTTAPRSARAHLEGLLREIAVWTNNENWERACQLIGAIPASPMYDLRIIRFALSLPVSLRAPVPQPKPVLWTGLLGPWAETRVKASQAGYYAALGASVARDHPGLFGRASLSVAAGAIRPVDSRVFADPRWASQVPAVAALEQWLRTRSGDDQREPLL